MRSAEYDKYIQSKTWKRKAKAARKRAGWTCERCGVAAPLDVHHKTYVRFKRELARDLEALCRPCHEAHHAKEGKIAYVIPEPTRAPLVNGEQKQTRQSRKVRWCPGHRKGLEAEFISKVRYAYYTYGGPGFARHVPPQETGACLGTETLAAIARGRTKRAGHRTIEAIAIALIKLASLEVPDPPEKPEPSEPIPVTSLAEFPEQLPLAKPALTGIQVARIIFSNVLDALPKTQQDNLLAEINARYPR